jgi:hypothetical protein
MKVEEVSRRINTRNLLPHLDCYSLAASQAVVIQGQHRTYTATFDPDAGLITCDCDVFKQHGTCDHVQALSAGLWSRLCALPRTLSLVTCTRDWLLKQPLEDIGDG